MASSFPVILLVVVEKNCFQPPQSERLFARSLNVGPWVFFRQFVKLRGERERERERDRERERQRERDRERDRERQREREIYDLPVDRAADDSMTIHCCILTAFMTKIRLSTYL